MRFPTVMAATAVLALAACNKPQPLTDAQKTALADSVDQVAGRQFAGIVQADTMLSYYWHSGDYVHAEYGSIHPTYDAFATAVRAMFRPGMSVRVALSDKHYTVLSRDVVVLTAMFRGAIRDSAGAETPITEAWTAVYFRTADGWKIAADHESVAPPAPLAQAIGQAPKKR